jgi:hypothetical protein
MRERSVDLRKSVDWQEIDDSIKVSAIAFICMEIEKRGLKGSSEVVAALFEARNALIHNSGDLSKNRYKSSLKLVKSQKGKNPGEFGFIALTGSVISVTGSVWSDVRKILIRLKI